MELALRHQVSLRVQRLFGYLNLVWFGPFFIMLLHALGAYRCPDKQSVRKRLTDLLDAHPQRPVLLCANHLTMIDSMLITWFLFDFRTLLTRFERFPWNVPELQNFGSNILLRIMCYLGKCVYVERSGSADSRRMSWAKVLYLNRLGETICIFPEGGRSRTGRVDREGAVYGVGQLVQENPETLVISVYLRGHSQQQYSFFPKRGDSFFLDFRLTPCRAIPGRRGQREITQQIIEDLEAMEQNYFATR